MGTVVTGKSATSSENRRSSARRDESNEQIMKNHYITVVTRLFSDDQKSVDRRAQSKAICQINNSVSRDSPATSHTHGSVLLYAHPTPHAS